MVSAEQVTSVHFAALAWRVDNFFVEYWSKCDGPGQNMDNPG